MKKTKYLALTLILSLFCMNKTYANCTENYRDELRKIEDKYKMTSQFNYDNKTYTVRIETLEDIKNFQYTFILKDNEKYKIINENTEEISNVKPGTDFEIYILVNTKDCKRYIKTKQLKLKNYNKYYGDPLCKGVEEFVLCQEFYDRELDRETFEKRIASYKNKLQIQNNKENNEKQENNFIEDTKKYVEENMIQVVVIVIFIILLIISTIIGYKTIKKSRRLE